MGGAWNTAYYLSASYLENTATVKGNKQQRFSIRSNLDFTFFFESLRSRLILLLLIM